MPDNKVFVHLHNHTEYSLLDGAAKIKALVAKAVSENAPAVAMTDHGNVYGALKFYDACLKQGIKPIIGCEFYVADNMHDHTGGYGGDDDDSKNKRYHLILLAKNYEGFQNISKLTSLSFTEGFYYKPRIDLTLLSKYSENLICLSACIAGGVSQHLLKDDYAGALEYATKLKNMFADGDFYIELQDHGMKEEKMINPLLFRISRELNVKCVATNDIHYIARADSEMHHVLLCIKTNKKFNQSDGLRFPSDQFYYKTYDEMNAILGSYNDGEALKTTLEIASKCDIRFTFKNYRIPDYVCPNNMSPGVYLSHISHAGLQRRYGTVTPEIKERAESELNVIIGMGFAEYFLIVWDFISFARQNDIPVGAGRGSGVGSIIAYAIGITNVDPLKYDLIFERFLNNSRTTMPDFDVDFCYNRRTEVVDYVKNKYGEDHISQIITFGRMKTKVAIKDVARVFSIPYGEVGELTKKLNTLKLAPDPINPGSNLPLTVGSLIERGSPYAISELIEKYESDETYKTILDIAKQIEGLPRNTSVHAAGVVIYKDKAINTIPLAKNGEDITTQFDMSEVENLGLLKMDFLALITLTDVKMAHDYVREKTGEDIDFNKLGYDDPAVYAFIATGDTDAVFQLEGGGMRKFMIQLRPKDLEDIIAGISLYRPGPMDAIPGYLKNRENPAEIVYKHELLKPILEVTYGTIIYQEQAMMITRVLAGYDMTRADNFRSIISKKKTALIPEERNVFLHGKHSGGVNIPGCIANGVPKEVGEKIFAEMESFASYAFNKSHAAAYAVLSYETAYYRHYHPVEYLAAVLNNRIGKAEDTKKYMQILKNIGIKLLPPDINKSGTLFMPSDGNILYGLACIKNVGISAMNTVITERKANGEFTDLLDFLCRTASAGLNTRALESLIKGGAFDCFGLTRATLLFNLDIATKYARRECELQDSLQMNMFDLFSSKPQRVELKQRPEFPIRERLSLEKETLGMYVSGHPLAGHEKEFSRFSFNTSLLPKYNSSDSDTEDESESHTETTLLDGMQVTCGGLISEITFKRTASGRELAVFYLEDMYDKIEVVAFSSTLNTQKQYIVNDALVRITGRLTLREDDTKITVSTILPWDMEESIVEDIPLYTPTILYVNLDTNTASRYEKIKSVLAANVGPHEVRFQFDGKIFIGDIKISNVDRVRKILADFIGPENVKIMQREVTR
ncbi:MAG: DNA polymerase III subunit alpha [Christensenellaceae bacterium]|jgi:DNA polymerase-3 subunit alpha|nr:DNA polymerase III subunit alpha [Christensenellaceae bacterium]